MPHGSFIFPLPGGRLISNFGQRGRKLHLGLDLKKSKKGGDSVLAARSGAVKLAQRQRGYGLMILLYHQDGCYTRYAHLRRIKVKVGQKVQAGKIIGTVGSSGRATTPHLHFEIITRTKRPIDPSPYLIK
ncbi:MAG: M23 family metallopeptidase [Elusimicrobiota bacterium]